MNTIFGYTYTPCNIGDILILSYSYISEIQINWESCILSGTVALGQKREKNSWYFKRQFRKLDAAQWQTGHGIRSKGAGS